MRAVSISATRVTVAAVVGLALAARLAVVLASRGGLYGNIGYDQGVYYAAADALLAGRLPYRDFVLLHPPGLALALTPFAALGHLVGDATGFAAATVACEVVGALSAGLIVVIARRLGLSLFGAVLGGCAYAVWFSVVTAEYSARLEPVGNFAFLCGLAALLTPPGPARKWPVLAGAALGFAVSVKMWWIVPGVLLIAWCLRTAAGRRKAGWVLVGALVAGACLDLPFLLAAPSSMWHMVVLDQFGRPRLLNQLTRLDLMTTLDFGARGLVAADNRAALAVCAAVAVVLAACAWRIAAVRPIVVITVVQFAIVMLTPRYYSYYAAFLAPGVALVIAAAAHTEPHRRPPRVGAVVAGLTTMAMATSTAVGLADYGSAMIPPFPGRALAAGVRSVRCVVTDSQMALIELNVLSRDLSRNCPDWVDVVGRTYGVDALPSVSRRRNAKWQRDLRRYLFAGDAVLMIYPLVGVDAATLHLLARKPVLAAAGGYTVYATARSAAPPAQRRPPGLRTVKPKRGGGPAARARRSASSDRD